MSHSSCFSRKKKKGNAPRRASVVSNTGHFTKQSAASGSVEVTGGFKPKERMDVDSIDDHIVANAFAKVSKQSDVGSEIFERRKKTRRGGKKIRGKSRFAKALAIYTERTGKRVDVGDDAFRQRIFEWVANGAKDNAPKRDFDESKSGGYSQQLTVSGSVVADSSSEPKASVKVICSDDHILTDVCEIDSVMLSDKTAVGTETQHNKEYWTSKILAIYKERTGESVDRSDAAFCHRIYGWVAAGAKGNPPKRDSDDSTSDVFMKQSTASGSIVFAVGSSEPKESATKCDRIDDESLPDYIEIDSVRVVDSSEPKESAKVVCSDHRVADACEIDSVINVGSETAEKTETKEHSKEYWTAKILAIYKERTGECVDPSDSVFCNRIFGWVAAGANGKPPMRDSTVAESNTSVSSSSEPVLETAGKQAAAGKQQAADEWPVRCHECDACFSSKQSRDAHVSTNHKTVRRTPKRRPKTADTVDSDSAAHIRKAKRRPAHLKPAMKPEPTKRTAIKRPVARKS